MPFDLFISRLKNADRVPAGALEGVPLPQDSPVTTLVQNAGYRDRYAIITGEDLSRMCAMRGESARELLDRIAMLGRSIHDDEAYLLHWEEWESGM